jgi:NAD(P)-dependent dehydrogenase (short-subunit alcohol dehydrogenase family)
MKKICLIGGSGLLGKYYAKKLSIDNEVHVADIGLKNQKKSKNLFKYYLDLNSEEKIDNFFSKNKKKPFDVLINNAAFTTEMAMKSKKFSKDIFSSEMFDQTLNINLRGIFLCCKYFIKYHHNKKLDQRVINVGTIYADFSPHHQIYEGENFFSSISYSTSKSGLIGMTKWLATRFASENTNFNLVSPAGVYNNHNNKFLKKYVELIPKKKMAKQKQIFSAIKFLISKDSDYVIGQNIYVDGGFSIW